MSWKSRHPLRIATALLSAALIFAQNVSAQENSTKEPVVVFAAASLKNALDAILRGLATGEWAERKD